MKASRSSSTESPRSNCSKPDEASFRNHSSADSRDSICRKASRTTSLASSYLPEAIFLAKRASKAGGRVIVIFNGLPQSLLAATSQKGRLRTTLSPFVFQQLPSLPQGAFTPVPHIVLGRSEVSQQTGIVMQIEPNQRILRQLVQTGQALLFGAHVNKVNIAGSARNWVLLYGSNLPMQGIQRPLLYQRSSPTHACPSCPHAAIFFTLL